MVLSIMQVPAVVAPLVALCVQAALAAKLLEEEWPDRAETAAARLAEREAATPVPERVWALRNVASTLVSGSLKQQFAASISSICSASKHDATTPWCHVKQHES